MDKAQIFEQLRMFLADPGGKLWPDEQLNDFLDQALIQYCKDAGCFTGKFNFHPDTMGIYHYPDDYVSYMIGWNERGKEIAPATGETIFDRKKRNAHRTGHPDYIYEDYDSSGCFSVYPVPADNQNVKPIMINGNYGEINNNDYGVFVSAGYGCTASVTSFDFSGTVYYRRVADFSKVKDYMALVCYAAYLAYNTDTDFGNADAAVFWRSRYEKRLSFFSAIEHYNNGKIYTEIYY